MILIFEVRGVSGLYRRVVFVFDGEVFLVDFHYGCAGAEGGEDYCFKHLAFSFFLFAWASSCFQAVNLLLKGSYNITFFSLILFWKSIQNFNSFSLLLDQKEAKPACRTGRNQEKKRASSRSWFLLKSIKRHVVYCHFLRLLRRNQFTLAPARISFLRPRTSSVLVIK